ncbi:CD209 antigen-like isoform X2 [Stylophora pistillata]|uniref:CD209 antigen-like isoform X1 n=1 Tax=Stylophora pistillata TaxID=50429 RepID=UPI000C05798E|nr:CD209 antigen-like isoform X1 [Stylophora pistillata]XP_022791511.1 CD209 antigen-like isoform X2 [Stylophora pistillata]
MAVLSPKKFAIITILPIFLEIGFSTANKDICGSIFETQVDRVLTGHILSTTIVFHDFECQLQCLGSYNNRCKSFNVQTGKNTKNRTCELNNSTRRLNPNYFKRKKGSIYYGSIQISCIDISLQRSGKTKSGHRHSSYKEKHCKKVCPTGWILFNNNCYLIDDSDSKTWLQAQTFCRSLKGELVKINSAEENDFVWDLVKRQATSVWYVWIGLKWNSTANGFYWYDHSVPVYNNWNTGEPNGRASEPCGLMYGPSSAPSLHGRWNDATCDRQFSGTACQRIL